MICKHILLITFLNEPELFRTHLNGCKHCYKAVTIQHQSFFAHSLFYFVLWINPKQTLPLGVELNMGAMTMKWYPKSPKVQRMEPHYQIV